MKKYIVGAILSIGLLITPTFSQAALTSTQIQAILSLLSAFGADSATIANVNTALTGTPATSNTTQPWCHTFNTNLKIGDSGSEVRALGTALTKEGFGNTMYAEGLIDPISDDGVYIEPTAAAVSGFQEKYASTILTPNGLQHGTGYVGPSTRTKLNTLYGCGVNPPPTKGAPSITILSPNGGESWAKGTTQTIRWHDNNPPSINCRVGETCKVPIQYYDIQLVPYYNVKCIESICPTPPYVVPYTIANGVPDSPYNWVVGAYDKTNYIALDGLYTIQICQTGSTFCDSSDTYFRIVSGGTITNNPPSSMGFPRSLPTLRSINLFRLAGARPTLTVTTSHGQYRGVTALELRERASHQIRKTNKIGHSQHLMPGKKSEPIPSIQLSMIAEEGAILIVLARKLFF